MLLSGFPQPGKVIKFYFFFPGLQWSWNFVKMKKIMEKSWNVLKIYETSCWNMFNAYFCPWFCNQGQAQGHGFFIIWSWKSLVIVMSSVCRKHFYVRLHWDVGPSFGYRVKGQMYSLLPRDRLVHWNTRKIFGGPVM